MTILQSYGRLMIQDSPASKVLQPTGAVQGQATEALSLMNIFLSPSIHHLILRSEILLVTGQCHRGTRESKPQA